VRLGVRGFLRMQGGVFEEVRRCRFLDKPFESHMAVGWAGVCLRQAGLVVCAKSDAASFSSVISFAATWSFWEATRSCWASAKMRYSRSHPRFLDYCCPQPALGLWLLILLRCRTVPAPPPPFRRASLPVAVLSEASTWM
jgi:hypothetical protein